MKNFSHAAMQGLCRYTVFKAKVSQNLKTNLWRCRLVREEIGWTNRLVLDANLVWEVDEFFKWMRFLSEFLPLWIEEPTSQDDIMGHPKIAQALRQYNIDSESIIVSSQIKSKMANVDHKF